MLSVVICAMMGLMPQGPLDQNFTTKHLITMTAEIALMVVIILFHEFSEHLSGLVPITVITWQCIRNSASTQEITAEVLSEKCLCTG